ncbi:MAG: ethanolamine utilization protein EutH [Pygmaiobacter massiliensis]|nr:ethanolamine utilization protein EutH [Pygmaiobacter massiliensis]
MSFQQIITWVMLFFLVLGAVDYVLGNKFGLGLEFENGVMSTGRLLLCMTGFMVLAPVIARGLGPVVAPFFRSFGADPSIFAGILLANDSGGAALAMELAENEQAGLFSGLIVGATLGTSIMFGISLTMTYTRGAERPSAIYGLLSGLVTVPLGVLAGGFAAGFDTKLVLINSLPVIVISGILLILLLRLGEKIVPAFTWLGKALTALSIFGFICGAVQQLVGITLIPGMDTLQTVFPIVGNIAIFLAGAFPLLAVVRRVFARGLAAAGRGLGINKVSLTGLIMTLANSLPTLAMMHDMDDKGRMLNVAFMISATCIFGDHLAYTAQTAPEMVTAVIISKAVGGITAVLVAMVLAPRLLGKQPAMQKEAPAQQEKTVSA